MVWKLKERELTLDEALEQAKVALSPVWFNSTPLIAVIKALDSQSLSLHPIEPSFLKKRWFFGFADPMTSEGEGLVRLMRELHDRYGSLNLGFILILKPAIKSLANRETVERFAKSLNVGFPYHLDLEESIFRVFGNAERRPMFIIMDQGKPIYRSVDTDPLAGVEEVLQKFLRQSDPGLPLLPVIADLGFLGRKRFEVALGKSPPLGVYDPLELEGEDRFIQATGNPYSQADFTGEPSSSVNGSSLRMVLRGKWIRDDERIATNDPNAELSYALRTPSFSVFAQSLAKGNELSAVEVLINGMNVVDDFAGEDLKYDDEQTSFAQFGVLRSYKLTRSVMQQGRVLTLKFPTADKRPIAIYSIRETD